METTLDCCCCCCCRILYETLPWIISTQGGWCWWIPNASFRNCAPLWEIPVLFFCLSTDLSWLINHNHAAKHAQVVPVQLIAWLPIKHQNGTAEKKQGFSLWHECLFSCGHLMTLTWGNIHLWQTYGRRPCEYLDKVPSVPSTDKGAQWISMISQLPLWCAFWRFGATVQARSESQLWATSPDGKWKYLAFIRLVRSLKNWGAQAWETGGKIRTGTLGSSL